ncbi:tetratricopeptide repeat protein [Sandaracinobacter sp. RS1-74]|uniref:tetratricopeptide repeat protein n=1 Tax=Sandaracinobacteroides sayramensis TaxID=2913411 RepID=UPI001EDB2DBD|nr:tetratricopeptide repeat protein [Sandaracinobacteroides sayramensis]MCG2842175.1 tetratricopeptide repeat protein [Sandaracinobacteroides sayramensis]
MSPEDRAFVDAFRRDVLEASLTQLVLVRFTAEWCGPCKQLAPLIDKAVAEAGQGRTKQVVIDIDQQRMIAEQFRIQSVPTVYAFLGGQPVDGFVGAKSEREIKAFIERLVAVLPPTEEEVSLDALVEAANAILAEGEAAEAANAFAALAEQAPEREDIVAGYARALLALDQIEAAEAALAALPADSKDQAVHQARAALDLAKSAAPAGELEALEARIAADPADHQARIDLANALFAAGRRDEAADQLLAAIQADREWNEGAARAHLLKLIEAQGFSDPWSIATRRRLSQILFA